MREALPTQADPLAPALAGALQQAIRSRLDTFVASDRFQTLWEEANRRAHARVVALLTTGQSGRLLLEGDTVYLDLGAVVDRVRQGLQERGLDRLAAAIPSSVDGQITLLKSEGLVKAREGVDLLERLTIVLPILALLCLGGHVALSRPRRRGLLRVGARADRHRAAAGRRSSGLGRSAYLDAINSDVLPRQAAADIFDALIELLRTGVRVGRGRGRPGGAARARARPHRTLAARSRERCAACRAAAAIGWVADHRTILQGVAVALGADRAVHAGIRRPPAVVLIVAALVVAAVALIAAIAGARQGATGA